MRRRIEKYRKRRRIQTDPAADYNIGCILLQILFFFEREEWIPVPDWPMPTVQGKGFSNDEVAGRRIWAEVNLRLQARPERGRINKSLPVLDSAYHRPFCHDWGKARSE